jgi:uroporphyrinogen III methyltransferase / synthase
MHLPARPSAAVASLTGRTVVVTRPEGGGELQRRLEALGARVLAIPATTIQPLDATALDGALHELSRYAWAVFTSRNAVQLVVERLRGMGRHPDVLTTLRLAAVGSATAEALHQRGLEPAVVPARYSAVGVLDAMRRRTDVANAQVLYATAEGAADTLSDGLAALGAHVHRIPCYRSVRDTAAVPALLAAAAVTDVVTLTAPSAVAAWTAAVGPSAGAVPVVSIGAVTSDAARAAGLRVVGEAEPSTAEGLAEAVRRYFATS